MSKLNFLSLILAALVAMATSCNKPEQPTSTQDGLNSDIASETIIEGGVEQGYSLSYRTWIVPGSDENGTKSLTKPRNSYSENSEETPAKNGSYTPKSTVEYRSGSNDDDTVSVTLHDMFYHTETGVKVTTWDPAYYQHYTTHWERGLKNTTSQDFVTMMDSVYYLWIQYQEFSFRYELDFQVAHYNNGIISRDMPYYHMVVTDLGAEELECMETIERNDSVLARRLLKHSIKVQIGNKTYILNARVTLYRYMVGADPNRFVVRSEFTQPLTTTFVPTDSLGSEFAKEVITGTAVQYFSDGTTKTVDIYLDYPLSGAGNHPAGATQAYFDANNPPASPNILISGTRIVFDYGSNVSEGNARTYVPFPASATATVSNNGCIIHCPAGPPLDDGYTYITFPEYDIRMEYLRTVYVNESPFVRIKTYVRFTAKNYPPQDIFTENIIFPL